MKTVNALLNAPRQEQSAWIREKFPDFGEMAHEPSTCLGIFYPEDRIDLSEYESYPEDYDTIGILRQSLREFTDERETQILNGSPLTNAEALALKHHVADADSDGWVGVHSWEAQAIDGAVFVVALGYSEGQGGIRLDDPWLVESRDEARAWLKKHKIWSRL
ncbi:hypothetical protein [Marimonas arenosa]|uniref:Uncharacterized protein n=1 Tax=Marimonas arenosa TaxID=1795305 RepID=A0AAE3WGJ9_9RHOB|nr:hypothetical protein [Marimonas arenosa]MDQ2092307.1 hypothetical protein [Marimonas arenosa]